MSNYVLNVFSWKTPELLIFPACGTKPRSGGSKSNSQTTPMKPLITALCVIATDKIIVQIRLAKANNFTWFSHSVIKQKLVEKIIEKKYFNNPKFEKAKSKKMVTRDTMLTVGQPK